MKRPRTATVLVAVAAAAFMIAFGGSVAGDHTATEAAAGFDFRDLENRGFVPEFCTRQSDMNRSKLHPQIPPEECNFEAALGEFTGPEGVDDGVGPVFNAPGCGECHAVPIIGGFSQTVEKRAGYLVNGVFREPLGGSLIHDRALDPSIQELVPHDADVVAFRATISVLGDGFVEAISDSTLKTIASNQPASMRGQWIEVPVLEAGGAKRVGRFGWKNQHASLVSFSADAYLNEMGITSPTLPIENTSNGNDIGEYDRVPLNPNDPDDEGVDVELFALFMRATKAPPRDPVRAQTFNAREGARIFNRIGCGVCHTDTMVTAPPGTLINGGALKVAAAVGNKIIHPFSDYLLHDIGTGDGIVQNGGQSTRNKVRTSALWGLRSRGRFMHDGLSLTLENAILRHRNQAQPAREGFVNLRAIEVRMLLEFLMSL